MANTDARFNGEIFRKDHPVILAARRELAVIQPVKLLYSSSGYKAGTLLGVHTATGASKAYNDGNNDGSQTATCILADEVPATDFADTASGTIQVARGIFGGLVLKDNLTGYDAAGLVDLKGRVYTTATGTNILKF